jgi:hypothetical protein
MWLKEVPKALRTILTKVIRVLGVIGVHLPMGGEDDEGSAGTQHTCGLGDEDFVIWHMLDGILRDDCVESCAAKCQLRHIHDEIKEAGGQIPGARLVNGLRIKVHSDCGGGTLSERICSETSATGGIEDSESVFRYELLKGPRVPRQLDCVLRVRAAGASAFTKSRQGHLSYSLFGHRVVFLLVLSYPGGRVLESRSARQVKNQGKEEVHQREKKAGRKEDW